MRQHYRLCIKKSKSLFQQERKLYSFLIILLSGFPCGKYGNKKRKFKTIVNIILLIILQWHSFNGNIVRFTFDNLTNFCPCFCSVLAFGVWIFCSHRLRLSNINLLCLLEIHIPFPSRRHVF